MKKLGPEDVQNKLHRVVEIYAPDPQDSSTGMLGSGFAVTDDLVLTAKHVVQNTKQVRVRGLGEEWPTYRSAEVVWLSGAEDAALVRLADAPWSSAPDRDVFRLRWVHPSGQTLIPWIAYGFPQATQFPNGRGRELEAVAGDIIPGAGFKRGTLLLNVKSALPLPTAEHSSPWQGLSGAAILTERDRKLIGFIVYDPPGFETSRLQGIPVEDLVRDPSFVQLVGVQTTEPAGVKREIQALEKQEQREASWERLFALDAIEADTETVLYHLLLGEKYIPLELVNPDGASDFQRPDRQDAAQMPLSSSPDTHIMQWYTKAKGNLLILGDAGAGKTVMLLQLLRGLLRQAREDVKAPLPVVITLSSWDVQKQSFAVWLREELWRYYHISTKIGQRWIESDDTNTDKLVFLLDGLDEVAPTQQQACLDGIERYLKEHMRNVIICCRDADYHQLAKSLKRSTILPKRKVLIQPLTAEQVDAYLVQGGEQLTAVRTALVEDPVLTQMVMTPLMLAVLCRTYRGRSLDEGILRGSVQERRAHLFAAYVKRMLERERLPERTPEAPYTTEQMTRWLAWLAQQLMQRHHAAFYREQVQPDWLPTEQARKMYFIIMKSLLVLLFGGSLTLMLSVSLQGFGLPPAWALLGLSIGLLDPVDGGFYSLIHRQWLATSPTNVIYFSWKSNLQKLFEAMVKALPIAIAAWLPTHNWTISAMWILIALFHHGLLGTRATGEARDVKNLAMPNQGIRAMRNSSLLGLLLGLAIGFLYGLVAHSLILGVAFAIFSGVTGLTAYGGELYLQHLVIHIILWKTGYAPPPWKYVNFLDYATDRILLYQRGGGYQFIHSFLLTYFATLNQASQDESGTESVYTVSGFSLQQRKQVRRKRRKAFQRRKK